MFSYAWKRNTDLTCYIITLKPPPGSSPRPVCQSASCVSGHSLYRNSCSMRHGGELLWDRAEINCEVGLLGESEEKELTLPWNPLQSLSGNAEAQTVLPTTGLCGVKWFLLQNGIMSVGIFHVHVVNFYLGLPQFLRSKESAFNAGDTGDTGSIPGLGRCPGEGNGNPL